MVFRNHTVPWRKRSLRRSLRASVELAGLRSTIDQLRLRLGIKTSPVKPRELSLGDSVPVFFVVGMAKSGTTWIMRTLDSHPEVLCKGEGRFFGQDHRREVLTQRETRQQPSSLYNALRSAEYLRLWLERSVWTRDGDADEHIADLTRLATSYFLMERLSRSGKKIVGDKTPLLSTTFVKEIGTIYPEAKIIHIIRDGRDQAVSFMHQQGNRAIRGALHRLTPEELAKSRAYRENPQKLTEAGQGIFSEETLRNSARNWALRVGKAIEDGPALFGDDYTEARYEDLLERPHEEAERLFNFLGVDTSEKVVERAVSSASFEKLAKGRKRGQEDVSSFYRKGVAGDWKSLFTERDKQIYKEEAGELLIRLGYERDDNW